MGHRRIKHQFRDLICSSKLYIRHTQFISPGLKILACPAHGPSFSDPARPILQCSFLKPAEKRIFLSILDYKFEKI
jgi:hypothetical protein